MGTTNSAISTAAPKVNLSRSGQRLVLTFEGNWSVRHTQHREIDNLFSELDHQTPAEALQFDMSQLSSWDTSLLIVVVRAEEWCREHKVKFLGDSLPPNIASLVALAEEVPERKTGRGNKTSASLFEHSERRRSLPLAGSNRPCSSPVRRFLVSDASSGERQPSTGDCSGSPWKSAVLKRYQSLG